jgi:hypothetical protein
MPTRAVNRVADRLTVIRVDTCVNATQMVESLPWLKRPHEHGVDPPMRTPVLPLAVDNDVELAVAVLVWLRGPDPTPGGLDVHQLHPPLSGISINPRLLS